jgi:hypothetical protein
MQMKKTKYSPIISQLFVSNMEPKLPLFIFIVTFVLHSARKSRFVNK